MEAVQQVMSDDSQKSQTTWPSVQRPVTVVHGTDGHHQDGHEQVGDRQGGDQVVGRGMQLRRPVHSGDHKGVGERGGQGEELPAAGPRLLSRAGR